MRNYILVLSIILLGNIAFSQTTVNSIYSSAGLGEEGGGDHVVGVGIGNNTITMADSTTLNFYNPATYNTLATGLPLFSLGLSTRLSNYSEGNNTSFGSSTSIQHFALGFKIKKRFGLAFGLKPYSVYSTSPEAAVIILVCDFVFTLTGKAPSNIPIITSHIFLKIFQLIFIWHIF